MTASVGVRPRFVFAALTAPEHAPTNLVNPTLCCKATSSMITRIEPVRKRLVVENDDKRKQYAVEDLYMGIYNKIGIPITFDYHHHWCHPGELTQEEALMNPNVNIKQISKIIIKDKQARRVAGLRSEETDVMSRVVSTFCKSMVDRSWLEP